MTPEELDRLYDSLRRLEGHWETTHKEIMACRNDLNIHLETSIIRVKGYDEFDLFVKATMQELRKDVDFCLGYIKTQEDKRKGVEESKKTVSDFAGVIKYIFWFIITLFAMGPIIEKLTKLFGTK